jgi:hypothetical protein
MSVTPSALNKGRIKCANDFADWMFALANPIRDEEIHSVNILA